MDCLRSFQLNINQSKTFTGTSVRTWGTVGNQHWALYDTNTSTFNIQGFKNINLYSVELVGMVQTNVSNVLSSCTVDDYGILLDLNGQMPIVNGSVVSTNFWDISPTYNDQLSISKYRSKLEFYSPVQSLTAIQIGALFAQGQNAQLAGTINLRYNLTIIFNYKYEGE